MLRKMGWNLKEEAKLLPPFDEYPTPHHSHIMNIIAWNSSSALKPHFQSHVDCCLIERSIQIRLAMRGDGGFYGTQTK